MRLLVLGGSASGKSEYAEYCALSLGKPLIYIATMIPYGSDAEARIARHRTLRAEKGFDTFECYRRVSSAPVPQNTTVLLECLTNLAANEMFGGAGADSEAAIGRDIESLARACANLIVVSGNVFDAGTDHDGDTLRYMRCLAGLNRRLSARFDAVVEVVCGIPVILKAQESLPDLLRRG
ncbi:MAG: bifunctional adenosylcobinamide kinase/adenosylcobinamide-phosphate guanylyltransferase [Oscillospiraceae bacterium]|jgi:adenosylcobinamide kinase/adenosylcobinamide-phosphate guanylyltransferase|nr:bifunctional adenosylcobinamide kinase/adenosylcobinamide-phosphate guanylyltransferase [Oscillospiraceae bacterium]